MSFFDKKINVSRFSLTEPVFLDEIKSKLENFTAPKLNMVETEILTGWSNAEDLTSTDFSNSMIAEKFLHVNMRIAVKKLPSGLFKMLMAQKFAEYKRQSGKDFVPSRVKRDLKESVAESLLPKIAPTVKNVLVTFTDDGNVFAGTTSKMEKQLLYGLVWKTLEIEMEEVTIEKQLSDINISEFFTDIFRIYDTMESVNRDYIVHSPYVLENFDDSSCVKTGLSGMSLESSRELNTALQEGKQFAKIHLSVNAAFFEKHLIAGFIDEGDFFTFKIDGNNGLSAVILPESDSMNANELFVEKTELLKTLFKLIDAMVQEFIQKISLPDYEKLKEEWIWER